MEQLKMSGEDWRSDREIKQQARAEAARKKAAIKCSKKLDGAVRAMAEFLSACVWCDDESMSRGEDDGRRLLLQKMQEYSGHLDSVFNKGQ